MVNQDTPSTKTTTARETSLATRNGVKLVASMTITLAVAFLIRFWLPRALGPALFGKFNFALVFCEALFFFSVFGLADYIGKEVSTKPEHANDFFGGIVVLRLLISTCIVLILYPVLSYMNKGMLEFRLCLSLALFQLAFVMNATFAALLNSQGQVNELAILRVVSKIIWGAGIATILIVFREDTTTAVQGVAIWWCVGEILQTPILYRATRKHVGLKFKVDFKSTKAVLVAAFPFFLNFLATRIYDKIDVQMISVMTNDSEVGYYGAASNLALAGMLFLPILNAVVLPMGARIGQASREEMNRVMRAAMQGAIVIGTLVSIMLILHAASGTRLLFGAKYINSIPSLKMLSVLFPLTYMAVIGSMHLVQLDKVIAVTKISIVGLVFNPTMNYFLIPSFLEKMGPGGGGFGGAFSSVLTECIAATLMIAALGRAAICKQLFVTLFGSLGLALGLFLIDAFLLFPLHRDYNLHVLGETVLIPLDLLVAPIEVLAFLCGAWFLGLTPFFETLMNKIRRRKS